MILTVWSASPMARNLDRCSPGGTVAKLRQETSADISRRSVYSLSCPACDDKVEHIKYTKLTYHKGIIQYSSNCMLGIKEV